MHYTSVYTFVRSQVYQLSFVHTYYYYQLCLGGEFSGVSDMHSTDWNSGSVIIRCESSANYRYSKFFYDK